MLRRRLSESSVPGPYMVESIRPLAERSESRITSASERCDRMSPEGAIVVIGAHVGLVVGRALHVGGTGEHHPVDRLGPPAFANQLAGQPIEQLGMRRRLAAGAEVAGRGDDATAEMELPEAIHLDAGQQCAGAVLRVGDPLGQRPAAVRCAAARRRSGFPMLFLVGRSVEHLQHSSGATAAF